MLSLYICSNVGGLGQVSSEINAMMLHWSISVSKTGTPYWAGRGHDSYGPDDIYSSRSGDSGLKYYISYRDKNGKWLPLVLIDKVLQGVSPKISPDGKYFFFNDDGIYWMSAGFIEQMKPKE